MVEKDVEHFHALMKHEGAMMGQCFFKDFDSFFAYVANQVLLGRWIVWTVWTKQGKASQNIGFIVLYDPTPCGISVQGLMDKSVIRNMKTMKLLNKKDKYTYSEDALRTVIKHVIDDLKLNRVECCTYSTNELAKKLIEKTGFKREGRLREAALFDGKPVDILQYSIIQSDIKGEAHVNEVAESKCGSESGSLCAAGVLEPVRVV